MSITLPLKKMSVEEKIQVMESLWQDLCDTAESTLSPDWHKDVLSSREEAVQSGEMESLDWEAAKQKILEDIR